MNKKKIIEESKTIIKKYKKTPIFVYDKDIIVKNIKKFNREGLKVFYALKANYNKEIVKLISKYSAGFETVSIGEIKFLKKLGIKTKRIIFSGVCKKKSDILYAGRVNVGFLSVESYREYKKVLETRIKTKIILKMNLDIDAKTNKELTTCTKINKFGIRGEKEINKIIKICKKKYIVGIGFHLGSQIKKEKPYIKAIKKIKKIARIIKRKGINIKIINIGGGFGIKYKKEKIRIRIKKIKETIKKEIKGIKKIFTEPGRSIVGNTCYCIARIVNIKKINSRSIIAIADIGMESIIRPALYGSYHKIINIKKRKENKNNRNTLVGPICESTDIIMKKTTQRFKVKDIIAIMNTGAYCLSMRMNYNMRKKPREIILEKRIKKI